MLNVDAGCAAVQPRFHGHAVATPWARNGAIPCDPSAGSAHLSPGYATGTSERDRRSWRSAICRGERSHVEERAERGGRSLAECTESALVQFLSSP